MATPRRLRMDGELSPQTERMAPRRDRRNPSTDQKKARNMQRRKTSSGTKESNMTHQHNWLLTEATAEKDQTEDRMRAEAAMFWRRLPKIAKEHPEEIVRQATDRANLTSTQFAPFQREAKIAYLEAVTHHARTEGIKVVFAATDDGPGYICKECGGPAPIGVGYADNSPGARAKSEGLTECACGYSRLPEGVTASTKTADSYAFFTGYNDARRAKSRGESSGNPFRDGTDSARDWKRGKDSFLSGGPEPVEPSDDEVSLNADDDPNLIFASMPAKIAGESVEVASIPSCDICASEGTDTPAYADARLPGLGGTWANVCQMHFDALGGSLGTGNGQVYVKSASVKTAASWEQIADGPVTEMWEIWYGGSLGGVQVSSSSPNSWTYAFLLPDGTYSGSGQLSATDAESAKAEAEAKFQSTVKWKTQSSKTASRIDTLRDIVNSHQMGKVPSGDGKVSGVDVDPQTANMLVTLYDALSDSNKASFETLDLMKLINFGWSKVSSNKEAVNSIQPDGTVISDCPYCGWKSSPQPDVPTAMQEAQDHSTTCPARQEYYDTLGRGAHRVASEKSVEKIARDILAENGEPDPHPDLLADTVREVEHQMQSNATFRALATKHLADWDSVPPATPTDRGFVLERLVDGQWVYWGWSLDGGSMPPGQPGQWRETPAKEFDRANPGVIASRKHADVPNYIRSLDGDEAYEEGRRDGRDAGTISEPYADGFVDEVEGRPSDAEYWRHHSRRKHADVPNYVRGLDGDEAYEEGRRDGRDAEQISEPYADGFVDEVEGRPSDAEYWRHHSAADFTPTHTCDGVPVKLATKGGSVVPAALIQYADGTQEWVAPGDLQSLKSAKRTKKASGDKPLVQIGTENDEGPPLIIERPSTYPWGPGEREQYREATDAEYQRYLDAYSD